MSVMLDIINAVEGCKKHQCSTIAVTTCEKCPSFFGIYTSQSLLSTVTCIFPKVRYKCDSLCIRYMNKECITEEDEGEGLCDQPDMYREVGDVADALNEREMNA